MKNNKKITIAISIILVIMYFLWQIVFPSIVTQSRLNEAVRVAKSTDLDNGYVFESKKDWWGNPIKISRAPNEARTVIFYTAISPGKDGMYGTADDLTSTIAEFNKSRIAGKWTGEKSVQFFKGLKEGIKQKNKHDK